MTMKKLIYFLFFGGAALLLGASCDKESENDGPKLYVNTWMLNVSESSFLLLQLNDDGTAVLGQAYSSDDLESLRNSIDTEKLTPEQKTFLDGMKANDVLAMNGWYTMKPNADGSMVLCVSFEVMYPTDTRIMSIASYVKEVSADRMLIFSGDTSDDGKPMFDEVLSVEKSSVKPGTLYDQSLIMALPKKDHN